MQKILAFGKPIKVVIAVAAIVAALTVTVSRAIVAAPSSSSSQDSPQPAATPVRPSFASRSGAYPLKISRNGRYLTDQHGTPFLLMGDSPQALIVNVTVTEARRYFANRHAGGFNAVWINLLCSTYNGGRADGSTYDGIVPFTKPGDLSTPNPVYFKRVDEMLRLAESYHLAVFLDPIETGGWLPTLRSNGTSKDYRYGLYLGHRYKSFHNIVWMSGNDFQTWTNSDDMATVKAVMQGLHDADRGSLQTIELNYYSSGSLDGSALKPLLGLDAAYTYYPTYAQVLKEYNRAPMPVFMVEAHYDGENVGGEMGTPNVLRRQEYWTMLSGAAGQFYGSEYWNLHSGWQQHLDTIGTNQIAYFLDLFGPRRWYALVPDQHHLLVTAGYGSFSSSGNVSASDYVTAARTSDGRLAMAYLPTPRTITVNMARLTGPVRARWYDPTRGTFVNVSRSPFAGAGTRQFSPPGHDSAGDGDWVLILETAGRRS